MIVRVLGEGQVRVADERGPELLELDRALNGAVTDGDAAGFERDLRALLDLVHACATPVAEDLLAVSDLIIPGAGSTVADVHALLAAEGVATE